MNNFEVIIGIENHVELKTNSKMFGLGPVTYGEIPNSQVSEIDMGYPGTMPSVNKEGVRLALLACNALNMIIDPVLRFDRKNYFYPDLVKGFQITQQFFPIGKEGKLEITLEDGSKKVIEIERLHIEEDTAKQTHKGDLTYIDFNRSGVGLVEIVSKPFIRSANEAVEYVNKLREILLYLGVSDVKMNEGSLRCDVNISLRPYGYSKFGPKVEIKNLNSLNNVKKAIEFEINRQSKILLSGYSVQQETRRFDESTQETVLMRKKDNAIDYKYFREPNIFPIQLNEKWIKEVINSSPELASQKREKYIKKYQLSSEDTNYILSDLSLVYFFEECIELGSDAKKVANYLITDIKSLLNKDGIELSQSKLKPKDISEIIKMLEENLISSKHVKVILPIAFETEKTIKEIVEENNLKLISDVKEIEKMLSKIIEQNSSLIKEQYEQRQERVEKTLMGQLMKETGGNVNPTVATEILIKMIKDYLKKC
ncbi:Asp-tRNA(Asn)/Glu-tRNA(Gln) amidotransferase subunit GatB [Spiroplasma floricola]|uniref:Aspartyl/glutamyl-tRNA(Asn/Gln) amidotransferase subunit B n=1 Tax=Spiroplasma floricola 23-6 TaxID=1336749 RepID=A0A2K8SCL3_9MOLU|nr:Asp-tRNA(Asn)/Glu-tRNA(Gln) amidotransferase subunit GatB [Spiroplasma floricola]AUB31176.1 aspartyl/glutamyl-tRNA amidotransferase subunit B [Spiroplasma floricola 23-6]